MKSKTNWLRQISAVVIAGCILCALYAQGNNTPAANSGFIVKGDSETAGKFEGEFLSESLHVDTDFGTATIKPSKVKSLSFRTQEDSTTVTVELDDHSRIQGKLNETKLALKVGGKNEEYETKTLRTLKFVKKVPFSIFAAILGVLTLSLMEIVLGVDNIIFLSILVGKLPAENQKSARIFGLAAALGTRIALLFSLSWLLGLIRPIFTLPEMPFLIDPEARDISFRDIILFTGGLFLIWKSVKELHQKIEDAKVADDGKPKKYAGFISTIVQIAIIDIVFSLDSVITAIGMVEEIWIMIVAMVIAMIVMLLFAKAIGDFVNRNPAIKVLALSFLILIGVLLIAEALGQHIDKGYIYFAMAFAVLIELINMRIR